ncbi:MAG: hypothetical protein AAGI01_00725 [Myxococcota bacterium]
MLRIKAILEAVLVCGVALWSGSAVAQQRVDMQLLDDYASGRQRLRAMSGETQGERPVTVRFELGAQSARYERGVGRQGEAREFAGALDLGLFDDERSFSNYFVGKLDITGTSRATFLGQELDPELRDYHERWRARFDAWEGALVDVDLEFSLDRDEGTDGWRSRAPAVLGPRAYGAFDGEATAYLTMLNVLTWRGTMGRASVRESPDSLIRSIREQTLSSGLGYQRLGHNESFWLEFGGAYFGRRDFHDAPLPNQWQGDVGRHLLFTELRLLSGSFEQLRDSETFGVSWNLGRTWAELDGDVRAQGAMFTGSASVYAASRNGLHGALAMELVPQTTATGTELLREQRYEVSFGWVPAWIGVEFSGMSALSDRIEEGGVGERAARATMAVQGDVFVHWRGWRVGGYGFSNQPYDPGIPTGRGARVPAVRESGVYVRYAVDNTRVAPAVQSTPTEELEESD